MKEDFYLEKWSGEFGDKYTERCNVDPKSREGIFWDILKDFDDIDTALEVGCNKGHNLEALKASDIKAIGIEPNKTLCKKPEIINANAYDIPWSQNTFDLVFTSGVLIHIPTEKLDVALEEIRSVAKKYVMMIEYGSKKEEGKEYRDFNDKEGVWSRPYGRLYRNRYTKDILVKKIKKISDIGNDGWGFSECSCWIFKKVDD